MNESFRIAQKLGLMFKPSDPLPKDMQAWAISQLHAPSPALGQPHKFATIAPWPDHLQPNLKKRAHMWRVYRENKKKERERKDGQDTQVAKEANRRNNLMRDKDELKFAQRNVYGDDQLRLRFAAFWANHFTIGNTFDTSSMIGHAIDEAIIANLNGDFANMLYLMTTHPGMLTYLDNVWSAGERSPHTKRCRKRPDCQAGLNDNLGRELLELHTLSPAAGYTETDIRNAAMVLSGWGVNLDASTQEMLKLAKTTNHWQAFKPRYAEPGLKKVFGKTIYAGKNGLKQLTDYLAGNEYTIRFISTKLCQHFVSDKPKRTDIAYISEAWRQSNGQLDAIHTAVIERAIASDEAKFIWPMTWLFQVIRLSEATFFKGWEDIYNYDDDIMNTQKIFAELGQSFWSSRQPDGYSSKKEEWLSAEMLERRIRFADAIYNIGRVKHSTTKIMDRMGANETTRRLVASADSRRHKFIALMCSPELMGLSYV
jgi:uncharacterized protein (DUF1800 family)